MQNLCRTLPKNPAPRPGRCGRLAGPYLLLGLLVVIFLILLPAPRTVWAQQVFKTQRAVIHFDNPSDLQEMEHRLRFTQVDGFLRNYFYTPEPVQASLSPRLAAKIDGLLTKVCMIMNMWPQNGDPVHIYILRDGRGVREKHLALYPFQKRPIFGHGSLPAFYIPGSRTIILSLKDLHEGVLAHEMAHHVLCQVFPAYPPADYQEEWAQYVERQLNI
jgi:hypothetical protein